MPAVARAGLPKPPASMRAGAAAAAGAEGLAG
jgi:hypothetical protein